MPKIKICGIRRKKDIEIVNRYKPDYIGFVFADSKRQISFNKATDLKRNLNSKIISVGVFVDSPVSDILELFENKTIEMAQLHGSESEEYITALKNRSQNKLKIIKAIEISENTDLSEYENSNADYLLFDSGKGSGVKFNWNLVKKNIKKDFFIAGGINKNNIQQAISKFNPYAIDLSSSLETDGYKDENKIKEIMEAIN